MNAKVRAKLTSLAHEIRVLAEEEQQKAENLPESMYDSDQYLALEEAADALHTVADDLDEVVAA